MRSFLASAALAIGSFLLFPSAAHAQAYVAPSLGVVFANPSAQGRADLVVDAGGVPRNAPLGAELDVMYAPSFFGNAGPLGENSVTTAMVNLIIAGGRSRYGLFGRRRSNVRPYVSGGVGLMHEVVTTTSAPVQQISNNDLGVNLGVGVLAFTHRSFGIRGDVRYFRDLRDNQQGNTTNIDFGSFHFWRASVGVILAF
jgi:Outer membrane protein beta-barrel domain